MEPYVQRGMENMTYKLSGKIIAVNTGNVGRN